MVHLIMLEYVMQDAEKEEASSVSPSCATMNYNTKQQAGYVYYCNSNISVMRATKFSVVEFKRSSYLIL